MTVSVTHREGHAALVEWETKGVLFRAVVPAEAVANGKIEKDVLDAGQPWGDDFSKVEGVTSELADRLKRLGVWTKADLRAQSHVVRNAIQQAYVVPLMAALLRFSKED